MKLDGSADPEPFAGTADPAADATSAEDGFNSPISVICDAGGRVHVADYGNNRVQVFDVAGRLVESIAADCPTQIAIHHRSGELYVFFWLMKWDSPQSKAEAGVSVPATLTRFGPPGDRRKLATYPLPFNDYQPKFRMYQDLGGVQYGAALDSWTDPPTVWLVPGQVRQPAAAGVRDVSWPRGAIKIVASDGDKLTVTKDFGVTAFESTARDAPASNARQLLLVDPTTGKLYVFEPVVASDQVVEIDPENGRERLIDLPHSADEICFDMQGLIHLRTATLVTRFDPHDWHEVPWDYGEEKRGVGVRHGRTADAIAALVLPGAPPSEPFLTHGGGFSISPKGNLVVQCWNGEAYSARRDRRAEAVVAASAGQLYAPSRFPGRQRWGEVHVFDRHGKCIFRDAIPGITITDGIGIDARDDLYALTNPTRTPGGKMVFNPKTETLIKFRPGRGKIITSGTEIIVGPEGVKVPVPLTKGAEPDEPPAIAGKHQPAAWVRGAEWMHGGVGFASGGDVCWNARCALDLFARSFAPEPDRFSVAVLDSNGNLILRVGKPGNADDGVPLVPDAALRGRSAATRSRSCMPATLGSTATAGCSSLTRGTAASPA